MSRAFSTSVLPVVRPDAIRVVAKYLRSTDGTTFMAQIYLAIYLPLLRAGV